MPLWSVEEWRVRIASSYSALGVWRPIKLRGYGGRIKSKRFVSSYPDRRYLSSFVETCWQKMSSAAFMLLLFLVVDLSNMISVSYLGSWAGRMVCLFTEMNYLTVPSLKCVLLALSYFKASLLHIGSIVATHDYGQMGSGGLSLTPSRLASADAVREMENGDSADLVSMAFVLVVMAALLLKSGNVERNPGPVVDDGAAVLQYLSEMDRDKIKMLGVELGLNMVKVNNMQNLPWDMVIAWLGRQDRVIEKCGEQLTWEVLAEALQRIGETGIADDILRDKCGKSGSPRLDLKPDRQLVLQDPIQRYAMYLKGVYKSALVSSDKFPNLSCNEFINLALVKGDRICRLKADEFTKATLHGHVDEIMKQKKPIKLEEVLKPLEGQQYMKCVYMYGAPGVGKSTCVGELCRRWDEIDALKRYFLVVLLRLREKRVQEAQNVKDLCYHDEKEVQEGVAAMIRAYEGKDVLFVLDGFDELPSSLQKYSIFVKIIRGTYLSHCTVLVTSRPSATANLLSVAQPQIHKQVEVIGFTQDHIEQYAKSFFASQPEVLANFLLYVSTHPAIKSLMYIPLNCAITAETYRYNRTINRPIPQTMTQLYTEMSLTLLQRHLGEDDPLAEQLPERLEDLPPQLLKPFGLLAEQAFKGLERNEVIFHNLPNSFVHFGFMNSPTELYMGRKALVSHSFLHLTLQEFLAAFHISQLQPSEQKHLFYKHCELAGWDMVWRFVAGLTGFHGIGWKKVLNQSKQRSLKDGNVTHHLVRYLYEAQEKVNCDSVLGSSEVIFRGEFSLTAFDCYAVGHCVANSKCMWKLDMYSGFTPCTLGGVVVEMLKHALYKSPPRKNCANILSLNVSFCRLDSGAFNLLADIIPIMTNLKELNISRNSAGDGGLVKLLHSLSHLKHLQTLQVCYITKIGCADIQALSCLISPSSSLKTLEIGAYHMSAEVTELMINTVFSPSSLEKVDCIAAGQVQPFYTKIPSWPLWSTMLEKNHNLTELHMTLYVEKERSHTVSGWISFLASALCKNSHLKILDISISKNDDAIVYCLNDEAVSLLVEMIRANQTLETLRLHSDCHTTVFVQVSTLSKALQFNNTLKRVEITVRIPSMNEEFKSFPDPDPDPDQKSIDSRIDMFFCTKSPYDVVTRGVN